MAVKQCRINSGVVVYKGSSFPKRQVFINRNFLTANMKVSMFSNIDNIDIYINKFLETIINHRQICTANEMLR